MWGKTYMGKEHREKKVGKEKGSGNKSKEKLKMSESNKKPRGEDRKTRNLSRKEEEKLKNLII